MTCPSARQVVVEEPDDDVVAVARFRHVRVIEEPVKETIPDVQLRVDSMFDELIVPVDRSAQLETARRGDAAADRADLVGLFETAPMLDHDPGFAQNVDVPQRVASHGNHVRDLTLGNRP